MLSEVQRTAATIPAKTIQENWAGRLLPNSFCEANIILMPQPVKDKMKREK